jgi:hypothetical protein
VAVALPAAPSSKPWREEKKTRSQRGAGRPSTGKRRRMGSREGRGADLVPGGGGSEERGGDGEGEGEEEEGEGAPRHRIGRRGIRLREGGGGGRREVGREISGSGQPACGCAS